MEIEDIVEQIEQAILMFRYLVEEEKKLPSDATDEVITRFLEKKMVQIEKVECQRNSFHS